MEAYKIKRSVLCIDLKSFFASVECALRGLDPFKTPLIVADKGRGGGSIVLAVTPYLKAKGMPSRCRLHEIKNFDDLMVAKPRMREYVKMSSKITEIYLRFVAEEDLHIYSIDEAFLDLTNYLNYYQTDIDSIAEMILKTILEETKLPATCGIGDNLLLSKLALDLYSKKAPSGIAKMQYQDVPSMLWPIKPLSDMWGIGRRMELRLNRLNIFSIYDLAHANIKQLKRLFGVIGEELYYHANGIDMSIISEKNAAYTPMKSVGLGQTLFRNYDTEMIMQIFLEMSDEVAERLRFVRKQAKTIHLGIGYSKTVGGGFSRQMSFDVASDDPDAILEAVIGLFHRHGEDLPIRSVFIRATNLQQSVSVYQSSFFEDAHKKAQRKKLWKTIDAVRSRFGKKSVVRLSSYLEAGTLLERSTLVGGHHG